MNVLEVINSHLEDVDFNKISTVQVKSCKSFEELVEVMKKDMTVTQSLQDCLAITTAVHLAMKFAGDPLWMYLVGTAGSGKSTICELLSSDEYNTRPLSKLTGLVSGSKQGTHLAPLLHNKCVVVKDGTLLLESSAQQLANVFGELRDIYDGSLEARYRNGVEASFHNISFGLLIGITETVYGLRMAALGERFLHCRLEVGRSTEEERNRRSIEKILGGKITRTLDEEADYRAFPLQRSYMAGFLSHLHKRVAEEDLLSPGISPQQSHFIQACADVVAASRGHAPRNQKDEITYRSVPEVTNRLVNQFSRLALCLCYVLNKDKLTAEILRLVHKVAVDSAYSRQYDILTTLALHPGGLSQSAVAEITGIPAETARRLQQDLLSLQVCQSKTQGTQKLIRLKPSWAKSFSLFANGPYTPVNSGSIEAYPNGRAAQKKTPTRRTPRRRTPQR